MLIIDRFHRAMVLAAIPMFALAIASEANAQQTSASYVPQSGASERIVYSGKLRTLSQQIVASSCNFAAGIDPEMSGEDIHTAKSEFVTIADALEHGNSELGITGAEKRRKTLARIGMLNDEWSAVVADLDAAGEVADRVKGVTSLSEKSGALLEAASLLVGELSAEYSDPTVMLQADAVLIDFAGRQSMLTQRMSKNICLIASSVSVDSAKEELAATAHMFEASLFALRGGNKNAGINPPPNAEVSASLNVVVEDWMALKPVVEATLSGAALSASDRARVYHGMNRLTANMNKVADLYSLASKRSQMF